MPSTKLVCSSCCADSTLRWPASTRDLRGPGPAPADLLDLEARVLRTGRLNTSATAGALVPRLAQRGQPGPPTHKRDLLTYVQRVPAESWRRVDLRLLGPSRRLRARDLRNGVDVACVPMIADPAEMTFEKRATAAGTVYWIAPRDLAVTRARVHHVVGALDASGAQLALAPELTLTPQLLEVWRHEPRLRRARRLRYVLVGSGNIDPSGDRAANTAVLLDGSTGDELGRQPKLFPFTMTADILERWELRPRLGRDELAEDLQAVSHRVTVFELEGSPSSRWPTRSRTCRIASSPTPRWSQGCRTFRRRQRPGPTR
jgi:hypothetical protein